MPFEPALYAGFIAIAAIAILSPGPDTVLILRHTIHSGWRTGAATVAGVQIGLVAHGLAAAFGLSFLITSIPSALGIIAILGAIYLIFLAIQQLRGVLILNDQSKLKPEGRLTKISALRSAFITNLLNPKVIMLFVALMPGFISTEHSPIWLQFTIFAATILIINTAFRASLVIVANQARKLLLHHIAQKTISFITAIIFIGFAVLLIHQHAFASVNL